MKKICKLKHPQNLLKKILFFILFLIKLGLFLKFFSKNTNLI